MQRWKKGLLLLLSLLPIYFAFLYMQTYGRHTPYADQWHYTVDLAIKTQQGDLTVADVFRSYNGHRYLGTNLVSIVVTLLTDWDAKTEMWINWVLLIINFGLILALFHQHQPELTPWIALPFSALLFLLHQDPNLLVGFQSSWHFVVLFLLLGLCAIQFMPLGWLTLGIAALCGLMATFCFGNGALVWFLLPITMWWRGYRQPAFYGVWIVLALLGSALYLRGTGIEVQNEGQTQDLHTIQVINPLKLAEFAFAFLGNPLAFNQYHLAIGLGIIGVLFFMVNALFLWREVGVWLAVAGYAIGSAVLIALTRYDGSNPNIAILTRYLTASIPLWVATVAVMSLASAKIMNTSAPGDKLARYLFTANTVFALLMVVLFFRTTFYALQMIALRQGYPMENEYVFRYFPEDICVLDYPVKRDDSCLQSYRLDGGSFPERILRMAAYRLNIFSDQPTENVLPETYAPGSPIVIHTDNLWLNVYIRDWMLHGIDAADLHQVAPDGLVYSVRELPNPPDNVYPAIQDDWLTPLLSSRQFWVISTQDNTDLLARLQAAGFFGTPYVLQQGRYREANYAIYRFQKPPEELEVRYTFGEEQIHLLAWSIEGRVKPCENVQVQSWWRSEAIPQQNYSTSLMLIQPNGDRIAQKDAAIGETLMQQWIPNQLYFDERVLTIPCELPAVEYTLAFSLYHYTEGEFINLTVQNATGDEVGERAMIQ